ncbi:MAG: isocitrate/isopropylmalate dehydrogenase family protein [Candidatus Aminicenantes bacterium]|nr:isocitrate/isopropylmalate dehydrogenase family protein [Candidatus Aminicenantes bacterium]NIM80558.1 isocitrate/isopropylmalate dehydrogenase family protein [Candidatus Aminicenantes bacterium]NIN19939.1 isocitrate/isopropylmalate dehydrogenase family protein [Candidatus Aminicenantes bacterium]NIN43787.1 isocitrate/isopropylmalate dehydrogenase family protein [Candidatus Aminicenantes bacterium]NIN86565.1 isocitrate/isopropylmalate dehydrogenase family protein [Candidatus Aminicenantes ba
MANDVVQKAMDHFAQLVKEQLERVETMKKAKNWIDYSTLKPIIIGIIGGDGIGPYIATESRRILEYLLQEEEKAGKVEFRNIEGLTIEKRAEVGKAIPDDVLEEIKKCHVTLKGPTTTPRKGDPWPNIESANVAMRRYLDLFANVRPVRVPKEGIDWIFFRENTEGAYVMGRRGIAVTDDLTFDFKVITKQGAERIIRMAFEYARKNKINRVTLVTKANVIKTTDGKFLEVGYKIAEEYPEIECDDWYIDIMTAKLVDPKRRTQFRVLALPNLYGDILTDEAAEFQGGVGTAGSANIGKQYAMFEAIHGSAPRMVKEGRAQYADPCSMIRAAALLMNHIGFQERGRKLEMALDICQQYEKRLVITGRSNGATGEEFGNYLMETIELPNLEEKWQSYQA